MIGLIDEVARKARVAASQLAPSDVGAVTTGPMSYEARKATIRVEGQTKRLLGFIEDLSLAIPGLTITGVRMGGINTATWVILSVSFLTNPTAVQGEN